MDLTDDHLPRRTPVTPPDVPGYTVGSHVGAGGSAAVWAATRDRDGAPVAVKVVTVGTGEQADAAVRELGVLARVEVEGLVRFHEAVTLPGGDRRVALVLDLVAGGSLLGILGARGHLSVGESVTVLAPVARALAGLHAAGVVHGDVTPGNVLVERSGRPLLADLGVARFVGEVPGEALGTEGFVAPEVLDGRPVSPASDVYAAGALAWWCVTGQVPGRPSWRPPLESLAPGLPAAWTEATLRALSSDPASRPTAAEASLAWFDSAECEPLRLVVGTDETSLLTHRLRRPAPEVVEAAPTTRRERLARAALAARGGRSGRAGRPGRSGRPVRGAPVSRAAGEVGPGHQAAERRPFARWARATRTPAALAGAGLALALVVGGVLSAGVLAVPGGVPPVRATGATVPVAAGSPARATTTSPSRSVTSAPERGDPASPRTQPTGLMTELAALRARAMVSGDPADLVDLDAPGSVALARDTADLRSLREQGLGYEGVRLTVRSARPVTVATREATVEAVVDTAAYRVVSVRGVHRTVRTEGAVRGQALRFALVWSGGRWLIDRVEPVG